VCPNASPATECLEALAAPVPQELPMRPAAGQLYNPPLLSYASPLPLAMLDLRYR
jgi:hypothetical protein